MRFFLYVCAFIVWFFMAFCGIFIINSINSETVK